MQLSRLHPHPMAPWSPQELLPSPFPHAVECGLHPGKNAARGMTERHMCSRCGTHCHKLTQVLSRTPPPAGAACTPALGPAQSQQRRAALLQPPAPQTVLCRYACGTLWPAVFNRPGLGARQHTHGPRWAKPTPDQPGAHPAVPVSCCTPCACLALLLLLASLACCLLARGWCSA